MLDKLTNEEIREIAKARAGFKVHATVYVIVNVFLSAIWLLTNITGSVAEDAWYYWPMWPHLGWGVGLAIHGFVVYGARPTWERREEERLRAQLGAPIRPGR